MSLIITGSPTMRKKSERYTTDPDGNPYHETKWDLDGHEVEVNSDEYGFHIQVDGDPKQTAVNLTAEKLSAFLVGLVRKLRGEK